MNKSRHIAYKIYRMINIKIKATPIEKGLICFLKDSLRDLILDLYWCLLMVEDIMGCLPRKLVWPEVTSFDLSAEGKSKTLEITADFANFDILIPEEKEMLLDEGMYPIEKDSLASLAGIKSSCNSRLLI